jgi:hypothetical protein
MAVQTNWEKRPKLLPPPETVEFPYVIDTDCIASLGIEETS